MLKTLLITIAINNDRISEDDSLHK